MKTYCIICKKDTENKNPKVFKMKNKRIILILIILIIM